MGDDVQEAWEGLAARGDEGAFEVFFARSRGIVYTIARRMSLGEEDAGEAFQNAYTRLLALARDADARLHAGSARMLVQRVAAREADALRKRHLRRARREVAMAELPEVVSGDADAGDALAQRELRARLDGFLEQLPEKLRLPMQLHYFHGMSHEEIAATLGVPRTTITGRIRKGLGVLRPVLRRAGLGDASSVFAAVAGTTGLLLPPGGSAEAAVVYTRAQEGMAALAPASLADFTGSANAYASLVLKAAAVALVAVALIAGGVGMVVYHDASVAVTPATVAVAPSGKDDARTNRGVSAAGTREVDRPLASNRAARDASTAPIASDTASQTEPAAESAGAPLHRSPAGPGVVQGFVRDRSTGEPIAGAEVRGFQGLVNWNQVSYSVTSADGAYRLVGLPGERVMIWAESADYVKESVYTTPSPESPSVLDISMEPGGKVHVRVVTESGEPVAGAELFLITNETWFSKWLYPTNAEGRLTVDSVSISGPAQFEVRKAGLATARAYPAFDPGSRETNLEFRMTARKEEPKPATYIQGVVRDHRGEPVEGALVAWGFPWSLDSHGTVRTGRRGGYRIEAAAINPARLSATKEGFGFAQERGVTPTEKGTVVNLTLSEAHTLAGVVVDPAGSPVPGAMIKCRPAGSDNNMEVLPTSDKGATSTGADGAFRLTGLSAGPFLLTVSKAGYSDEVALSVSIDESPRIVLRRAGAIFGRVVDKVSGKPIESFTVRTSGRGVPSDMRRKGEAFSGRADGLFALRSLHQGVEYELMIEAQGYTPGGWKGVVAVDAKESEPRDFPLSAGNELYGALVDATTGTPIVGAEVFYGILRGNRVASVDTLSVHSDSFDFIETTTTDAEGLFRIHEGDRKYTLAFRAKGYSPMVVYTSDRGRFTSQSPGTYIFPLVSGTGFRGRLTLNGAPVPSATLVFSVPARQRYFSLRDEATLLVTDGDGRFERMGLPAESYWMTVSWKDTAGIERRGRVDFVLDVGEVEDLDIVYMEGSFTLAGTALYRGAPVSGVQARATHPDGHSTIVVTDVAGMFSMPGLPSTECMLELSRDASEELPRLLLEEAVSLAGNTTRTFELAPEFRVIGSLRTNPELSRMIKDQDVWIELTCLDCTGKAAFAQTHLAGPDFAITGPFHGVYTVRMRSRETRTTLLEGVAIDNRGGDVDLGSIAVPSSGDVMIDWSVVDGYELPEDPNVVFTPLSGEAMVVVEIDTDQPGPFRASLPAGVYRLAAVAPGFTGEFADTEVTIREGEPAQVRMRLVPSGFVMGVLSTADGSAPTGIRRLLLTGPSVRRVVNLSAPTEDQMMLIVRDRRDFLTSKHFVCWDLPKGQYTLQVEAEGYRDYTTTVTAEPGRPNLDGIKVVLEELPK